MINVWGDHNEGILRVLVCLEIPIMLRLFLVLMVNSHFQVQVQEQSTMSDMKKYVHCKKIKK